MKTAIKSDLIWPNNEYYYNLRKQERQEGRLLLPKVAKVRQPLDGTKHAAHTCAAILIFSLAGVSPSPLPHPSTVNGV